MFFQKLTLATVAVYALQGAAADSIAGIAGSTDDFSTLVTAVTAAGLAGTLSDPGTFTVFAPTNAAFEKLPTELVTKLLEETWQPQLKDLILYHALGSEVMAADLVDGMEVPTLNGENITVTLDPVTINGESKVVAAYVDVDADNGVIHGIDTVLTPTSVTNNIVDIAAGNPAFTTLVQAVTAAGLVDALSGDGPLTVFAPTNDAFAAVDPATLASVLLPENKDQLIDILKYHVVAANVPSSAVETGEVEALNGDKLKVDTSSGVMINDAKVIMPDIIASNGIIHVIDKVLMPPADPVPDGSTAAPTKAATATPPTGTTTTTAPTQVPTSGAASLGSIAAAAAIAAGAAFCAPRSLSGCRGCKRLRDESVNLC